MPEDPLYLWAKKAKRGDADPLAFHPLLCHLLDVGAAAEQLWTTCLPASAKAWFARQLGLEVESAGRWAIFFAALHDWGKASPAFQTRDRFAKPAKHGTISTFLLESGLQQTPFNLPRDVAVRLAVVAGGHHGVFPLAVDTKQVRYDKDQAGTGRWKEHQRWLLGEITRLLDTVGTPRPNRLTNAGAVWLAGFISVADWIGSNQDYFPYAAPEGVIPHDFSADAYVTKAREQAARAIAALGWGSWPGQSDLRTFADLFPDIDSPNAMQEEVVRLAKALDEPFLVIIEAPMGLGKTEAALFLADHANVTLGMRGHYLALPTQATSNQMFSRDTDFLQNRYPSQVVNTQLLHGHAALSSDFKALRENERRYLQEIDIPDDQDRGFDNAEPGVIAAEWFTYRKRGLLAPFGVGTIDQALLSVLQTKHFFVRLLGLAGKTVVFDEVHAYDAYMLVLLERLLGWLAALGCSVVLLSATLPAARRESLLRAWSGPTTVEEPLASTPPISYPAITWRGEERGGAIGFDAPTKSVRLRWLSADERGDHPQLAEALRTALRDGGCAAVICNTVRRAQEMYAFLRDALPETEVSLFHARFPYEERMALEEAALRQFGKPIENPNRPHRAVLVATQVIEQSLDLDFDLMVTALAPGDLVLQRSGRLHRHTLPDPRPRPAPLAIPELWLLAPPESGGLPAFPKPDRYVYDEHILLRSWLALRPLQELDTPARVSPLIEAIYDDTRPCPSDGPPGLPTLWAETRHRLLQRRADDESKACRVAVYPPGSSERGFLTQRNQGLEEDNPELHESFQALTRLGEPNITAICLTPEEMARLCPRDDDAIHRAEALLKRSLNLTHRGVVPVLASDASYQPEPWKRTALLRYCRLVELKEGGEATIGGFRLRLDPKLGVEVVAVSAPSPE